MIQRVDYYAGIGILAGLLLLGDFGLRQAEAQRPLSVPSVIKAHEFQLIDDKGKLRAKLYFAGEKSSMPSLDFWDGSKRRTASLCGDDQIPSIDLSSYNSTAKKSTASAGLMAGPDPNMSLDLGKGCVFTDVDSVYGGNIMLHDQNGLTSMSAPEK